MDYDFIDNGLADVQFICENLQNINHNYDLEDRVPTLLRCIERLSVMLIPLASAVKGKYETIARAIDAQGGEMGAFVAEMLEKANDCDVTWEGLEDIEQECVKYLGDCADKISSIREQIDYNEDMRM